MGWLSRVEGLLSGAAARSSPPGNARSGARTRRRGARVLGCASRRLPRDQRPTLLAAQIANVLDALPKSTHSLANKMLQEIRDAEDKDHARQAPKAFAPEFRPRWPKAADKVSELGSRGAALVLRLPRQALVPRQALGAPEDHERDRVVIRDAVAANEGDKGPRLTCRRAGDGLQAARLRRGPMASDQRTETRRPRASRRQVPRGVLAESSLQQGEAAA